MIGFTKALAQENAKKGITVNAIAPGYIDTEMVSAVPKHVLDQIIAGIPVGRLGMADEIARCVAFLAAEDAGYITGSTLSVNGGQYIYRLTPKAVLGGADLGERFVVGAVRQVGEGGCAQEGIGGLLQADGGGHGGLAALAGGEHRPPPAPSAPGRGPR